MGYLSVMLNVVSLIVAGAAVGISVWVARHQSRLTWSSNQIAIVLDVFKEFRHGNMQVNERLIRKALGAGDITSDTPFSSLPDDLQAPLHGVCHYYQQISYLVFFGGLDRDLAFLALHHRASAMWDAVKPHVMAERRLRGGEHTFMNAFEDFALYCRSESPENAYKRMVKRRIKVGFPALDNDQKVLVSDRASP